MSRRALAVAAALIGLLVAFGVAVSRDGARPPTSAAASTPHPTSPLVRLVAGSALPVQRALIHRQPTIPGTDSIAAREPDPAGGPDWAVRTFQRRALMSDHRVWCAQLGRIVDGAFAWIQPGGSEAKRLPLAVTETTTCASTSPIAEQLGIATAGMPTAPLREAGARIGATIVWGVIDRPVAAARLEHATLAGPLTLHGHAILRVEPGSLQRGSWTRLVVTDRDGGQRAAAPLRHAQGLGPVLGTNIGRWLRRKPRDIPVGDSETFQLAARVDATADGPPRGIFTRVGGGDACATDAVSIVGDRAVEEFAEYSGLVVQLPMQCTRLPEWADWIPTVIGASWSSGNDAHDGSAAAGERTRRRTEERLVDSSGTVTVATPPGTRMLVVTSPVGVKTVRVPAGRVTTISWRGQPDVLPALFPQSARFSHGRAWMRGRVVTFEALDASGKRIGRVGSSSPSMLWQARKQRAAAEARRAHSGKRKRTTTDTPADLAAKRARERPAPTTP